MNYWYATHIIFNAFFFVDIGIHVGSNDLAEEGVFIWSNGEPVTNGWIEGEPNNILDDEDCVSLKNGVGFNDISCNFDYIGFICEQNGR